MLKLEFALMRNFDMRVKASPNSAGRSRSVRRLTRWLAVNLNSKTPVWLQLRLIEEGRCESPPLIEWLSR